LIALPLWIVPSLSLASALTVYSLLTAQFRTGRVGFTHTGDPTRSDHPPVHNRFDASFDYTVPTDGSWVHLTFVGQGESTALYVDGELMDSVSRAIELPTQFIGVMGRYGSVGGTNSAAGLIDEVVATTPASSTVGVTAPWRPPGAEPATSSNTAGWSRDALIRLGLPGGFVRALEPTGPDHDLAWTTALTEALRPTCRPLPAGPFR
jgi:hypothetical protein